MRVPELDARIVEIELKDATSTGVDWRVIADGMTAGLSTPGPEEDARPGHPPVVQQMYTKHYRDNAVARDYVHGGIDASGLPQEFQRQLVTHRSDLRQLHNPKLPCEHEFDACDL